jgi:hypothetical protein
MDNKKLKEYEKPELQVLGTIEDLTETGGSKVGSDQKDGSVLSSGI